MERIELRLLERCGQDTLRFSNYSQQNKMISQLTTLALPVSTVVSLVIISTALVSLNGRLSGPQGGVYIFDGD